MPPGRQCAAPRPHASGRGLTPGCGRPPTHRPRPHGRGAHLVRQQPACSRRPLRVRAESPIVEDFGTASSGAATAAAAASAFASSQRSRRPVPSLPVFNRERWAYHRESGRYARHMQSIFRSVTFRHLRVPLGFVTANACLVVAYRMAVARGLMTDYTQGIHFTDVPFQLTSFALSLLLVFRTDASYSRWCAAIESWGTLRSSATQLMRKAASWVPERGPLDRLVRWVSAFSRCLLVVLRYDAGAAEAEEALREELGPVLRPYELEQLMAAGPYYPQFCLSVLTALVEAAQLSESREAAMLDDLHDFNECAGRCEKILRFPIPLTYTRHTSRFMLIYLTSLPLALYDSCDWAVVPVTAATAFLLLGIEDIGVQIEEPFTVLPLPEICADIQAVAQRAVTQRHMVRCLADPQTCSYDFPDAGGQELPQQQQHQQHQRSVVYGEDAAGGDCVGAARAEGGRVAAGVGAGAARREMMS